MQALEGRAIEHFHISRRLARGGMSDIYLAQDTLSKHPVVVKIVHNSNQEYCARFRCEIQTTASLKHEHILPALAHGEYEDWCYMVSPYIQDGTLSDHLAQGPLSLDEADDILTQLASALQFAHDSGIIHRDLKPSNILLRDKKHVLLADFGLAKQIDGDDNLTVTGYLIGTPEYMAPELAEGQATIKSDVYALGIIAYQLLTGRVPFKGSTPIGTYLKHIRECPLPPTMLNPNIPEAIEEVILRALEKNPGHRFNSVRDLAYAYHAALTQHKKQTSQFASSLQNRALLATARLKLPTSSRMYSSLLGITAVFCLVFISTALGFAFYSTNHPMLVRVPLQGVGVTIPNAQSARKAASISPLPTQVPTSQPLFTLHNTKNDNSDDESQENPPGDVDKHRGNENNDHGHSNDGGHKGKDNFPGNYTVFVVVHQDEYSNQAPFLVDRSL
jgi:serine/threonine protein kinase